jgi:hypothetical protein
LLGCAVPVKHDDVVRVGNGAEAVGDYQHGFPRDERGNRLLNGSLVLRVKARGRLVARVVSKQRDFSSSAISCRETRTGKWQSIDGPQSL